MKKYSFQCILSTSAILALFVAINWLVDPYWIYGTPEIKRFNLNKPSTDSYQRLFKITNVLLDPPQALIIGTSREHSGINPKHPAFNARSVFNVASSAQQFLESREILHALSGKTHFPELIVFGLIFENGNEFTNPLPADHIKDNFDEAYRYKLLISLNTLKSSVKTITMNLIGEPTTTRKDGFRTPDIWADQLIIGEHRAFIQTEREFFFEHLFHIPACKNDLANARNGKSVCPMQELREAISTAYRMKSDMRLFIGPSHARIWETIQASGLWGQFEDWKRMLVEIVESEAVKAQATPFQIWDFSGYNSITEEDVPSDKDIGKRMLYYYDPSHYTPAAGNLVLDRIFKLQSTTRIIPDDFGILLTSNNIEAHFSNIRLAREHYRQTHSEDVAEIEAMAREVAKTKLSKNPVATQ